MGILKTMGYTSGQLRKLQLLQYTIGMLGGMAVGVAVAIPIADFICRMTVTTTGIRIPSALPGELCILAFAVVLALLMSFIWVRTGKIRRVSPVTAIRGDWKRKVSERKHSVPVRQRGLLFWMALRQLFSGKRRYAGVCLVAMLLVFFASLIGRVNAWLGPDGKGLMDAFNPADLHIAAQPMGNVEMEEVEQSIREYTDITDQYMLAMPGVSVNGIDYTANVITEPERFHLLDGETCADAHEIVLTEFAAADLGVSVGDTVAVAGNLGSEEYTVSGIYQCANDMGANIGMSREGYDLIGEETPAMWCTHYFIEHPELQPAIMQALESTYGGDVYLHENSWPGLAGILSAMKLMMIFLYVVVVVFVLIVTVLTAEKLLYAEQPDLAVYKTTGFSVRQLRMSFMLRFAVTAVLGSVVGTILSCLLTDPFVAVLMRSQGISDFSSSPGLSVILLPGTVIVLLFMLFSWCPAGRIRHTEWNIKKAG